MKHVRGWFFGAAAVAIFAIAAVLWWQRTRRERAPAPPAPVLTSVPREIAPPPPEAVTPEKLAVPPAVTPAEAARYLKIQPTQVLATVNGAPITLNDLVLVGAAAADKPQTMSPEMFDYLLNRAIERELIFQAAHGQGIELTEEQNQQLAQMRESMHHEGADQTDSALVERLNVKGSRDEQIDFEVRDAAGQLLLGSLLAKAGVPSPHVTEAQVGDYYQSHRDQFGTLPDEPNAREAAWRNIDTEIRQTLAPSVQAEYQKRARALVDQLRALAKIEVTRPPSS